MDTRLLNNVAQFLTDEYLPRLQAILPDRIHVHGCYLYGSVTLGAYDPVKSDLDFMTVLTHQLDDDEVSKLGEFHKSLRRKYPLARRMEGQYVPLSDVMRGERSNRYPSINYGRMLGMQGMMTLYWYQLHTCGVKVIGPDPADLFPPVEWELVRQEMDNNINGYWLGRTRKGKSAFLADESVEFAVLTPCRILYTLEHQQIIPKVEAAHWALQTLPVEWHRLVQEALRIRTGSSQHSLYFSRWQRAGDVCAFILAMRERISGDGG